MNDIPCTYRISVKAIVKDAEARILLLRKKDGSWELPGGGTSDRTAGTSTCGGGVGGLGGLSGTNVWGDDRTSGDPGVKGSGPSGGSGGLGGANGCWGGDPGLRVGGGCRV